MILNKEAILENMINVVRSVGTVSVPQLVYFFRDVCPNKTDVELCIKDLMIRHILIYNKAYNWVSFHSAPKEKDEMIRRKVMAFWIIANVASDNVREIYPMGYPSQLIFVVEREGYDPEDTAAEDADINSEKADEYSGFYDITVCEDLKDASLYGVTKNLNERSILDDVNHIALVPNDEVGREALKYGFDNYCILAKDPDQNAMIPQYSNGEEADEDET